jgi:cbb3-type cytochrome oxidase subunit 3
MNTLMDMAPTVGLLIFFIIFMVIFVWVLLPSNKQRLRSYGEIPLKEEAQHGRE